MNQTKLKLLALASGLLLAGLVSPLSAADPEFTLFNNTANKWVLGIATAKAGDYGSIKVKSMDKEVGSLIKYGDTFTLEKGKMVDVICLNGGKSFSRKISLAASGDNIGNAFLVTQDGTNVKIVPNLGAAWDRKFHYTAAARKTPAQIVIK